MEKCCINVRLFLNADSEATSAHSFILRFKSRPGESKQMRNLSSSCRSLTCRIRSLFLHINGRRPTGNARFSFLYTKSKEIRKKMKRKTKAGVKLVSVLNSKSFHKKFAFFPPKKRALLGSTFRVSFESSPPTNGKLWPLLSPLSLIDGNLFLSLK